jgi:RNA recognition motif-containing protein
LRGYGHVVFDSAESRAKAVDELNGMHLGARFLTFQPPKAPRADTTMGAMNTQNVCERPEGCKTVHITKLPWDATEDNIRNVFQICGKILDGGVRLYETITLAKVKNLPMWNIRIQKEHMRQSIKLPSHLK